MSEDFGDNKSLVMFFGMTFVFILLLSIVAGEYGACQGMASK